MAHESLFFKAIWQPEKKTFSFTGTLPEEFENHKVAIELTPLEFLTMLEKLRNQPDGPEFVLEPGGTKLTFASSMADRGMLTASKTGVLKYLESVYSLYLAMDVGSEVIDGPRKIKLFKWGQK